MTIFLGDKLYLHVGNHHKWLSGEYERYGSKNGHIRLRMVADTTICFFIDGAWWIAWCEHESGWFTTHHNF